MKCKRLRSLSILLKIYALLVKVVNTAWFRDRAGQGSNASLAGTSVLVTLGVRVLHSALHNAVLVKLVNTQSTERELWIARSLHGSSPVYRTKNLCVVGETGKRVATPKGVMGRKFLEVVRILHSALFKIW